MILAQHRQVPEETDDPVLDVPLLLRLANQRVERDLRDLARSEGLRGLTPTAMQVLRLCSRHGKPIVSLAERLLVSPQAVGQVVTRLENSGLVERGPHPMWGSSILVVPTAAGLGVVAALNASLQELAGIWADDLPPGRLDLLAADLETLAAPPGARWRGV